MRPFLKWAGSKRWLVRGGRFAPAPEYCRYIEPFLGSAAVFFDLLPDRAILSDSNPHLVNCYQQIRRNWRTVFETYTKLFYEHSEESYYEVRKELEVQGVHAAAQFLYLNRTCFNGVFRVNLAGRFNVPIGSKVSNPFVYKNFRDWSAALQNADIRCDDFGEIIAEAGEGDFIFADPPYTVAHNRNGFIEYNENIFSWNDQIRLADSLIQAQRRGAHFMLTNANHSSVRQLYEPYYKIEEIDRRSVIAGDASKRGSISEIVVSTY